MSVADETNGPRDLSSEDSCGKGQNTPLPGGPRSHVFVPGKRDYVRGQRPKVDCILCEVVCERDTVTRLEVTRTDQFVVSLNIYPYNPGHLLVFPVRHVEGPNELDEDEALGLHRLTLRCLDVLGRCYQAGGFNVGYNIGRASGASLAHFHIHIVPRYPRESGFMDIIGGSRIYVDDPLTTQAVLKRAFAEEPQP